MSGKELHIYTRVSTRAQEKDGTSLDTQRKLGTEVAKKLKLKPVLMNEGGKSSNHEEIDKRPVLQKLLLGIEEGTVKHLYSYNIDRLSRKDIVQSQIRYQLSKHQVMFYSGNDTSPTDLNNPQDKLFFQIHSAISEYDNSVRTARSRLGKAEQVKKGQWHGGPPPFGYKIENKLLAVEVKEAEWVREIYQLYSTGESIQSIRKHLFQNNVMTRRGNSSFSSKSLENILHSNTHYQGFYIVEMEGEEPIRVTCPSIVDRPLVKKVQKQLEKRAYTRGGNRTKQPRTKHETLLREVMMCGHCDGRYGSTVRPDKHIQNYYCISHLRRHRDIENDLPKCDAPRNSIKIDETDMAVVKAISEVLNESSLFKEEVKQSVLGKKRSLEMNKDLQTKIQKQMKQTKKELSQINEQIKNLNVENLIGLNNTKDITDIIKRLEQYRTDQEDKLNSLENDLDRARGESRWVDWVQEFGERLKAVGEESTPIEERKRFIEGVVDSITVTFPEKQTASLEIRLNYPYVGDSLVYVDPRNRRKGYKIKEGRKDLRLTYEPSVGNRGKKQTPLIT
jgi:site-specific DNA recombinase